jgi:hypothetical protein
MDGEEVDEHPVVKNLIKTNMDLIYDGVKKDKILN